MGGVIAQFWKGSANSTEYRPTRELSDLHDHWKVNAGKLRRFFFVPRPSTGLGARLVHARGASTPVEPVVNNQEAKFILSAYRPNGCDAADPFFAEALRQARQDPMLAEWFACQQAFDRAICSELAQISPPCGLRESILAGSEVSGVAHRRRRRSSSRVWMGLAAGLALIFTLLGTWNSRAEGAVKPLPEFASNFVAGGYFLAQHGSSLTELTPWLEGQAAPLPADLPAGLQELHTLGCSTVNYHGRNLSLICFGQDKQYHLFIARRADFPEIESMEEVNFLVRNGLTSATWSDRVNHYVVVSDAMLSDLKICLNCPQN